ncbi:2594_t:CDS:2, partial [Scutellospora calospora]
MSAPSPLGRNHPLSTGVICHHPGALPRLELDCCHDEHDQGHDEGDWVEVKWNWRHARFGCGIASFLYMDSMEKGRYGWHCWGIGESGESGRVGELVSEYGNVGGGRREIDAAEAVNEH